MRRQSVQYEQPQVGGALVASPRRSATKAQKGRVLGLAPSPKAATSGQLEGQVWFHGDIGRQEADALLRPLAALDGNFLVRRSAGEGNVERLTLSATLGKKVAHARIRFSEEAGFWIGTRVKSLSKFNNLSLMVRSRWPGNSHGHPVMIPARPPHLTLTLNPCPFAATADPSLPRHNLEDGQRPGAHAQVPRPSRRRHRVLT